MLRPSCIGHFILSVIAERVFKYISIVLFLLVSCISDINAQEEAPLAKRVQIGGFYSFSFDREDIDNNVVLVGLAYHYFDVHLRTQITDRWHLGCESVVAIINSSEKVDNPFVLAGLHGDFRVVKSNIADVYGRFGLSMGNLSFAGNGVPERRFVLNRVIGFSVEVNVTSRLSLDVGFYNHYPLNKIPDRYGASMPFLGFHYRL